ncbi:transposase [Streptomyces canus]
MARRIQQLTAEVKELTHRVTKAVRRCHPQLLDIIGVGPDSAAALLLAAGDNPERLASEASFAALCGVSPVEQSCGKTQRRRLSRGGNRQANAALYRIVASGGAHSRGARSLPETGRCPQRPRAQLGGVEFASSAVRPGRHRQLCW